MIALQRSSFGRGWCRSLRQVIGIQALALLWLLVVEPWYASSAFARVVLPPVRLKFQIDPKSPLEELLPVPPAKGSLLPSWLIDDLDGVPEIRLQDPSASRLPAEGTVKTFFGTEETKSKPAEMKDERSKRFIQIAYDIAKINHVNQKGTDEFIKLLMKTRADLAGLPFVMGEACRTRKETHGEFTVIVPLVGSALNLSSGQPSRFWDQLETNLNNFNKAAGRKPTASARIAALMQMLAPDGADKMTGLVEYLSAIEDSDATRALARLALFSFEKDVRSAALKALQTRPTQDYSDFLLTGLRYPWPAVAQHAADALVELKRKDLVGPLVDFLDEPDPRAPVIKEIDGRKVAVVRELVKINHHRNCLLCHAPGNTPDIKIDDFGGTHDVLTGAVPVPGQPLSTASRGYDPFSSPDIRIRTDVTYLRQDFSLMQKVKNAAPWPVQQRFDYLVRTRAVTDKDVASYRDIVPAGMVSPQHRAAVLALQALTGYTRIGHTAQAWRKELGLAKSPKKSEP